MKGLFQVKQLWITLLMSVALPLMAGPLPVYRGHVNDFAEVLSQDFETKLESALRVLAKNNGPQLAVAVIKDLDGRSLENYAVDLFEKWGVGRKGKDNGLLILLAMNERKVRIEVGYGLEQVLTDSWAGRVRDQLMVPRLQAGDVDSAIWMACNAAAMSLGYPALNGSAVAQPGQHRKTSPMVTLGFIILLVILGMIIGPHNLLMLLFLSGSGRRGGSGGGFGGGGFGGFGGSSSGGGGSSGSW